MQNFNTDDMIKRRIVVACAACILANQQVTVREAKLLAASSSWKPR